LPSLWVFKLLMGLFKRHNLALYFFVIHYHMKTGDCDRLVNWHLVRDFHRFIPWILESLVQIYWSQGALDGNWSGELLKD
jgi:hypothetical protein